MSSPIIDQILERGSGDMFCRFANADGKVWMMPVHNMRTAMNLYQPSGRKGKLMKQWFPLLSWSRLVRRVVHAEKMELSLRPDLYERLSRVLGANDFEFSVFGGTPCVHQKITIQLSHGKQILGYCKLSGNAEIKALFKKEAGLLNLLEQHGMTGCIPEALYCGELEDGIGVFVQSTEKTASSSMTHDWMPQHNEFLKRLQKATQQRLPFEETDYYKTLTELSDHLDWLPEQVDKNLIEKNIEYVFSRYSGQEVDFSAYHADFTPWNMFMENRRLFVFDFEYALLTYPPGLDRYHFFLQTAYFEGHWSAEEIIGYMQCEAGMWIDENMLRLYLLDVISRFTIREKGKPEGDIAGSFDFWNSILTHISR